MKKTTLETGVVVREYLSYNFGWGHVFKVNNPYLKKYPLCNGTTLEYLTNNLKEVL